MPKPATAADFFKSSGQKQQTMPESELRDDISPTQVAHLVNMAFDVLNWPSPLRGAKDEDCTLQESANLVHWMSNIQAHKAYDAPPGSSSKGEDERAQKQPSTLSVLPGPSSNSKGSAKVLGQWKSAPNIFNNGKDVSNVLPALGASPGFDSSRSGQELVNLRVAAEQMDTLLENRYGEQYICTALKVLFFAKGSKSLHFGEYPAKVHWPQVPEPVSNSCCRQVADVTGKKYALVDLLPMRAEACPAKFPLKT
jgi:hypothetical protein